MTTTNNITGDRITTASKPMTDNHWEALFERIRSKKNIRDYENGDMNLVCQVCQKDFLGNEHTTTCRFCT